LAGKIDPTLRTAGRPITAPVDEVQATGAKTAMSHKTVTSGKNQVDEDELKGRRSKNNGDSKI
jgi:hypothetical protein